MNFDNVCCAAEAEIHLRPEFRSQADAKAGAALAAYRNYNYASAVQQARAAYDGLFAAADQINVQLTPSAYQAIRRNPADYNLGDRVDAMSGEISSKGIRGLETHALVPTATKLTDKLPQGEALL